MKRIPLDIMCQKMSLLLIKRSAFKGLFTVWLGLQCSVQGEAAGKTKGIWLCTTQDVSSFSF